MDREAYLQLMLEKNLQRWAMPLTIEDLTDSNYNDSNGTRAAYLELKGQDKIIAVFAEVYIEENTIQLMLPSGAAWNESIDNYNKDFRLWQLPPTAQEREYLWK